MDLKASFVSTFLSSPLHLVLSSLRCSLTPLFTLSITDPISTDQFINFSHRVHSVTRATVHKKSWQRDVFIAEMKKDARRQAVHRICLLCLFRWQKQVEQEFYEAHALLSPTIAYCTLWTLIPPFSFSLSLLLPLPLSLCFQSTFSVPFISLLLRRQSSLGGLCAL